MKFDLVFSDQMIESNIKSADIQKKLNLILEMFSNLITKLESYNLKEMPDIYSISKICISANLLQADRYFENEFLYYQTEYRKKFLTDLREIYLEKNIQICLTGIQAIGKSHFLSDYVLRNRIKGKDSDFRILYMNESGYFNFKKFIINELLYELCFDIEEEKEIVNFPQPPNGSYLVKNQILQWLIYLDSSDPTNTVSDFYNFLKHLHIYFRSIKKRVIFICDQINNLKKESLYKMFCENNLFDLILISSQIMIQSLNAQKTSLVFYF